MVDIGLIKENEDLKEKIKRLESEMSNHEPKRQADLEHLSKIPVIETHITYIRTSLQKIETAIVEVPTIKNDVLWLKLWHNKIVLGVILSSAVGILSLLFTIFKKGF